MKRGQLTLGLVLALSSVWAVAQEGPESLLPSTFDKPAPKPSRAPSAQPQQSGPRATLTPPSQVADPTATPVVQPLPAQAAPVIASGRPLPSLREIEGMSPEELDELLGIKPPSDIPPAARRGMTRVGVIGAGEGGFEHAWLAGQDGALVRAALAGNKGVLVSRWGHILLRRALASRLDAPAGMNPADFAALRAGLLVRMGEGDAARAVVQDVDPGNYSPALVQSALDAYLATADITGSCPMVAIQGGARKDADWRVLRSVCAAFQGEGASAMAQLDRYDGGKLWPKIDILLAQKYAGAAGSARRAVKIEWDQVNTLNPWRFALALGTGSEVPAALLADADPRYQSFMATAPMLGLTTRADAADRAAGRGVLSSAAMIDLYGQIYADEDITGDWRDRSETLRSAYVASSDADRLAAIRRLWDSASDPAQRYSRQVLTAYAAARLPAAAAFAKDAPELIASMLAAGLDANALRWLGQIEAGDAAWAQLVLAAPSLNNMIPSGDIDTFKDDDASEGGRKTGFLVAGLAGLGRIEASTRDDFGEQLGAGFTRASRWSQLIDQAAETGNPVLVALLAGLGMQGEGWDRMTPRHLYHIVSALNRVGLGAEARMIAAEAVARG